MPRPLNSGNQPTKVIRIPVDMEDEIARYIDLWRTEKACGVKIKQVATVNGKPHVFYERKESE